MSCCSHAGQMGMMGYHRSRMRRMNDCKVCDVPRAAAMLSSNFGGKAVLRAAGREQLVELQIAQWSERDL